MREKERMERNTRPGVPLCAADLARFCAGAIRVHASGRVRQQPRGLARGRPEETPEHGSGRLVCLSLLRGEGDTLCEAAFVRDFAGRFGCSLTEQPGGEHWFHTPEELAFFRAWLREKLPASRWNAPAGG